jgi:cysteine desulfurase
MFSISAHKFGGPKGIGGLMVIPHLHSELANYSLISGGKQEFGLRAGTENAPYIVGMAKALNNLKRNFRNSNNQEKQLRDYAIEQLVANFPYIKINGAISNYSHPGILNFSIGYADAASVVEWMNLYDICISSGSACNTGSNKPSHVLTAMGLTEKEAFSSIRLSFSAQNTKEEIDEFIRALKEFESRFYH